MFGKERIRTKSVVLVSCTQHVGIRGFVPGHQGFTAFVAFVVSSTLSVRARRSSPVGHMRITEW
jgi:hypothetical protein